MRNFDSNYNKLSNKFYITLINIKDKYRIEIKFDHFYQRINFYHGIIERTEE